MKMRKWMSALLATSMVAGLALTGCGNSSEGNADTTANNDTQAAADETTAGDSGVQPADKIQIFQSKVEIQDASSGSVRYFL